MPRASEIHRLVYMKTGPGERQRLIPELVPRPRVQFKAGRATRLM